MATSERKLKVIVFAFVSLICFGGAYLAYRLLPVWQGEQATMSNKSDYLTSFYNRQGNRISSQDGSLALLLDPFVFYVNYPNQRSASFRIDEEGCRASGNRESEQKLAIVIGGSTAFGKDLPTDTQTFSSVLNSFDLEYFFYNCGIVGYASGQELALMVHYLDRMKPDLYLVFDGWNDIFGPLNQAQRWPVRFLSLGYNPQFRVMESRLQRFHELEEEGKSAKGRKRPPVVNMMDRKQLVDAATNEYISNIQKMHDFSASRGVGLLVVLQPDLILKPHRSEDEEAVIRAWGERTRYLSNKISDGYLQLITSAKQHFKQNGIRHLDINDSPVIQDTARTLFLDPVHLNAEGHRLVAEQIRAAVEHPE
jgi:lysophospholipase L1-like esterase